MYVCPSCYLEQDSKDGFCRECGTQIVQVRYCDSCGVKARGAEDFCRECGAALPEVVPFVLPGAGVAPPAPDAPPPSTPAWLKENEPSRSSTPVATKTRTKDKDPDWLRGKRSMDDNILVPRPAPPAPRPVPVRGASAPTVFKRGGVSTNPSRSGNLQGLLGVLLAVAAVALASSAALVPALLMIVVAMVVGGKPLLEMSTAALHRAVDWIWEDPVLRKRMLDE